MKYKYLQDFYLSYTYFLKVAEYVPVTTNTKKIHRQKCLALQKRIMIRFDLLLFLSFLPFNR